MDYEYILYEKKGAIAYTILNRPEKRNALSPALQEEVISALLQADDDPEVRVVVIKGKGPAFCGGYDSAPRPLEGGERRSLTIREDIQDLRRKSNRWNVIWNLSKPVIAQVHGYCIAGATDLALHCDIIVAADDAKFDNRPSRSQGSPPTHMWTYLVGPQWAKYLLLTGNSIDGKTAERIGLVWKAVQADKLEEEVNGLAGTMAKIPWDLLAANKSICNKAIDLMGRPMLDQLAAENDAIAHQSPSNLEFGRIAKEQGLKAAWEWREASFRDSGGGREPS